MLFSCWCCICCNPSKIFLYLVAESYVYDVLVVVVVVVCCCCCCCCCLSFKNFDAGVVLCGPLVPGPLSRASLVGLWPGFDADSNIYIMMKCSCVTKNDHLLELHQKGQLGPPVSDEKWSLSQVGKLRSLWVTKNDHFLKKVSWGPRERRKWSLSQEGKLRSL